MYKCYNIKYTLYKFKTYEQSITFYNLSHRILMVRRINHQHKEPIRPRDIGTTEVCILHRGGITGYFKVFNIPAQEQSKICKDLDMYPTRWLIQPPRH